MPRPGVTVTVVDEVFPAGAQLDTGQAFAIGACEKGAVDEVIQPRSLKDYEVKCGGRSGGSLLYDFVNAYFAEGGAKLFIGRLAGAGMAKATIAFGAGLTVDAESPGTWGNGWQIAADNIDTGPAMTITVMDPDDEIVEVSGPVTTEDDFVAFGQKSSYVDIRKTGTGVPADGTTATLAGGSNGSAPDSTSAQAALDLFTFELGPGQVNAPGMTSLETHQAIGNHCDKNYRVGVVDLPDTPDAATLSTAIAGLYEDFHKSRWLLALGTWVIYPHPADPATIQIPYSGVQSGLIARLDKRNDPSLAAAGANGISRLALGLVQTFTDDERELLNDQGVAMAKEIYGQVRTYGYRTAAGPDEDNWKFFQESRVIMNLAHRCNAAMEEYVFNTIDGKNHLFAKVNTMLTGICQEFFLANALYGNTPEEAFRVITDESVNTIDTINDGEVHAVVKVKTSRIAEWVVIDLIKTSLEKSF